MKRKLIAMLSCVALAAASIAGCSGIHRRVQQFQAGRVGSGSG